MLWVFDFDCLDCFSPILLPQQKSRLIFAPQPKNRSRAYAVALWCLAITAANSSWAPCSLLVQMCVQTLTTNRLQSCISQLKPTKRRLNCVRVNVLGHSGVGKSSLIEALKCGYVRSLFRRTGSGAAALLSAVTRRSNAASAASRTDCNNSTGMIEPHNHIDILLRKSSENDYLTTNSKNHSSDRRDHNLRNSEWTEWSESPITGMVCIEWSTGNC